EAAVRGDRRPRTPRHHDAGDGVRQIQVLARDAIHVGYRDALDARQVLIRIAEPVEGDGVGPDRGEVGYRIALELRGTAFLQLGCRDELGRYALAGHARQDLAHVGLESLRIIP